MIATRNGVPELDEPELELEVELEPEPALVAAAFEAVPVDELDELPQPASTRPVTVNVAAAVASFLAPADRG
jgi:hypothetical protein